MPYTRPVLQHPEVYALFEYDLDIPDSVLNPILALPRETLIADLESVGRLSMKFTAEDIEEEVASMFSFHAIMLLAELRSEESLPLVLDVLNMAEDDLDFWFDDYALEEFWAILLWCGQNRIPAIVEFIKNQEVSWDFSRIIAVDALEQIAFHFPERRDEIVETMGDLLQYFNELETFSFKDINAVTYLTSSLANLNASEYLPTIEQLYKKKRVDDHFRGTWEVYQKDFGDVFNSKQKLWIRYRDWLNTQSDGWQNVTDRKEESNSEAERLDFIKLIEQKQRLVEERKQYMEQIEILKEEKNRLTQEIRNKALQANKESGGGNKIGRNDPCPCGSGKKYKKCCGGIL